MPADAGRWYGVRCVFRWVQWEHTPYEERITLWRASSSDEAIELAWQEADRYAGENGFIEVGYSQAYAMDEDIELGQGVEVFSLLRDSELPPDEYLERFFRTGREHEQ